jgi:hypothetical protein
MLFHAGDDQPHLEAVAGLMGLDPLDEAGLLGEQPEEAAEDLGTAVGRHREGRARRRRQHDRP